MRCVHFVSLRSVPEGSSAFLPCCVPLLLGLHKLHNLILGVHGWEPKTFYVFIFIIILCFHFYHNLDSDKSIFWIILITLGLSRAADIITISMCLFFFAIGLCQSESPGSGHGSCLNRRKGAGGVSHPEMWVCQTHEPGQGSQDHVNVTSGTSIFICQLAIVEAVLGSYPVALSPLLPDSVIGFRYQLRRLSLLPN